MVKIAIQSNRNPKYPTKSRSIPIYIYTKVYIYNNSQLKSPLTSQQIVPMVVFLSNHHFKILFNPKYPHYIPLNKKIINIINISPYRWCLKITIWKSHTKTKYLHESPWNPVKVLKKQAHWNAHPIGKLMFTYSWYSKSQYYHPVN